MIYLSCNHQQLHNGGWLEEVYVSIAGKQERVAIAPCKLRYSRFDRVHSWLATLTVVLHRKIVHEEVLRQMLARRYGYRFGFWSVPELMRGLPVFYRHRANRYYLLRDVIPFLPRLTRLQRRIRPATNSQTGLVAPDPPGDARPQNEVALQLPGQRVKALEDVAKMSAWEELARRRYTYKGKP
jgi:hypothetical protein